MIDPDEFFGHGHPLFICRDLRPLTAGVNGDPTDLDELHALWGVLSDNANGSEALEHSGTADDLTVKYAFYFQDNSDGVEERIVLLHGALREHDGREVFAIDRIGEEDGTVILLIAHCRNCGDLVRLGNAMFESNACWAHNERERIEHFPRCEKSGP